MAMVAGLAVLTFAAYRIGIWILRALVFASGTRVMATEGVTGGRNLLAKRAFESEDVGRMNGGGEQVFVPVVGIMWRGFLLAVCYSFSKQHVSNRFPVSRYRFLTSATTYSPCFSLVSSTKLVTRLPLLGKFQEL